MSRHRFLRAPALLIAALAAVFIFAAAASAETWTGETTTTVPFGGGVTSPETSLVRASASYETTGGGVSFEITTAAPPLAEIEGPQIGAALFAATSECNLFALATGGFSPPLLEILDQYKEPTATAALFTSLTEGTEGGELLGPASKTVSGTTTTLAITSGRLANQVFNCALVDAKAEEEGATSLMFFPLSVPPAPAALSIAKPKVLKLKAGKWKRVKVKVTDTGATATTQGSLRLKPIKGVLVKPKVQKLPILAPRASWTVSVRVKLTKKAKKKSRLSLIGTASGVRAKSSLVVKLAGGRRR